jgi:CheY-like chemotaxis protein
MSEVALCTILYVEDDPDDALLFKRAFARAVIPCALHCVNSTDQARCYLLGRDPYSKREKFPMPNLVITDLTLQGGGESALSFIRWLQNQSGLADVEVACLTGSDDPRKLREITDLGVSLIRKTSVLDDALEVIRKIIFR